MRERNKKNNRCGITNLTYSIILASVIVMGFVLPAYAVELNAAVSSTTTTAKPSFQFVRAYVITYPNGGDLKNLLYNKNVTLTFHVNLSDSEKKKLLDSLNKENLGPLKSSATISDVDILYSARLAPSGTETHIDYKIVFVPTISNYVLRSASGDTAAILDTQWRGLSVNDPIMVNLLTDGQFDINSPISFIKNQFPNFYNKLHGSDVENLFEIPLMSSNDLMDDPISKWQHLFDPAYTLIETNALGYKGQKITISTYSTGESNISEGEMLPTVKNADLKLDQDYPITLTERASTASIQIDGYVAVTDIDGIEYFGSSPQAPQNSGISSTGDYPVQVIYSMAGLAAVVAAGVFWWSNRTMKKERERAKEPVGPSYPIEYETRKHWADRFDE